MTHTNSKSKMILRILCGEYKRYSPHDLVDLAKALREYPTMKPAERKVAAQSLAMKAENCLVRVRRSGKHGQLSPKG